MNAKKIFSLSALAATGLVAVALATPAASAQVDIRIGSAPPPLRYEVRPNAPGDGYVWTDGFYEPYGNRYRWHPGYWQRPPYQGAYYVHPHWDHYPDGWRQHEGYWAHEDHDNHYWENHRDDHRDDRRDGHRDDHHDDHHEDHHDDHHD